MIRYSVEWHLENARQHATRNEITLRFVSDWNNSPEEACLPKNIISEVFIKTDNVVNYIDNCSISADRRHHIESSIGENYNDLDVAMLPNATSSLFSVLKTLRSFCGLKKIAIGRPAYYAVDRICSLLSIVSSDFAITPSIHGGIRIENLEHALQDPELNCILLTDPVYCAGIPLGDDFYEYVLKEAEKRGVWVVFDGAFTGPLWTNCAEAWFPLSNIRMCANYERAIFIDSPSKRLLTNSIKFSLVYSSRKFYQLLENILDVAVGGLSLHHKLLFYSLYLPENNKYIISVIRKNQERSKLSYELLQASALDRNCWIAATSVGFHTVALSSSRLIRDVNPVKFAECLLYRHGVVAIPLHDFGYPENHNFGFRINLLKHPSTLRAAIVALEYLNVDV